MLERSDACICSIVFPFTPLQCKKKDCAIFSNIQIELLLAHAAVKKFNEHCSYEKLFQAEKWHFGTSGVHRASYIMG